MFKNLIIKDAFWQILWRILSALWWFLVIKLISPYLWPLRFWDYSTILKYFAIWSALVDFWLYVLALKKLWEIKNSSQDQTNLISYYSKFFSSRLILTIIVYTLALSVAFAIPSYNSNPYIFYWLIFWMLFSASFMLAGIIQLPLQLYWKMEQLSIALVLARISQLFFLILVIYWIWKISFDFAPFSVFVFCIILFSLVLSWMTQFLYVYFVWTKLLPLHLKFDFQFTLDTIKQNRQYWVAYYLSSFHTLIVLILLSIFFPTILGFSYTWVWWLSLALIEIFLIIPSSLWNSLIHRVWWYDLEKKMSSFWALLNLNIWIWFVILLNFVVFWKSIIYFVWWEWFLSNWNFGSEFIIPFLWIVLILSFVKQIFNYVFVSNNIQNKLLKINLIWVLIWTIVWVPLIFYYNIVWWIITQILLEILFVFWWVIVWFYSNSLPKINFYRFCEILLIFCLFFLVWIYFVNYDYSNIFVFLIYLSIFNLLILIFSVYTIKKIVRIL